MSKKVCRTVPQTQTKNLQTVLGQESWTKVCDGSECTITCKIVKDPSLEVIHDYKQVKFEVGEAELYNLPAGIDFAVKKMQRNEIARIGCKLNMAMTDKAFQNIKIEPQVSLKGRILSRFWSSYLWFLAQTRVGMKLTKQSVQIPYFHRK